MLCQPNYKPIFVYVMLNMSKSKFINGLSLCTDRKSPDDAPHVDWFLVMLGVLHNMQIDESNARILCGCTRLAICCGIGAPGVYKRL